MQLTHTYTHTHIQTHKHTQFFKRNGWCQAAAITMGLKKTTDKQNSYSKDVKVTATASCLLIEERSPWGMHFYRALHKVRRDSQNIKPVTVEADPRSWVLHLISPIAASRTQGIHFLQIPIWLSKFRVSANIHLTLCFLSQSLKANITILHTELSIVLSWDGV